MATWLKNGFTRTVKAHIALGALPVRLFRASQPQFSSQACRLLFSLARLTPGEDDEEHGDEHHEQLKEPLDHPLTLLRAAYSCSHGLVSHFFSLYLL